MNLTGDIMINKKTIESAIFGVVIGDALGVPYEFTHKILLKEHPVSSMDEYGTYNKPRGTWSDDTSMTLGLLDSLSKNKVDYDDIMKKFIAWYDDTEYTSDEEVFDIGRTTLDALNMYKDGIEALKCGQDGERSNGNGSLMRIIPITLYNYIKEFHPKKQFELVSDISSLTHAHPISTISCNIYNILIQEILKNPDEDFKTLIEESLKISEKFFGKNENFSSFNKLFSEDFFKLDDEEIESRGYVVSSLEVALYSCYHTDSYKEAVLKAVNYAGDTDTNTAIAGGLAGLYYGIGSIPEEWVNSIRNKELVYELCQKFYENVR